MYQAWLAGNPRFGAADMRRANVLLHTNYQSLLNGNVSALSTARLGDAKSIPAVDQVRDRGRLAAGMGAAGKRGSGAHHLMPALAHIRSCWPATTPCPPQMVTAGFPAVVDALTPGLDIRYGVRVTAVEQGADSVIVTAANGTRFAARYALVTPSLGCLKAGNISFVPPLPEAKAAAIRDMVRWPEPACKGGSAAWRCTSEGMLSVTPARPHARFLAYARPHRPPRATECWTKLCSCSKSPSGPTPTSCCPRPTCRGAGEAGTPECAGAGGWPPGARCPSRRRSLPLQVSPPPPHASTRLAPVAGPSS